ncbi:MAG TPA: class I SAM-dependent methyltransferase [Holophagaceae bacterium]|nr:class I SAM-dependent methyltransferase [Holophagaceae bacterium]
MSGSLPPGSAIPDALPRLRARLEAQAGRPLPDAFGLAGAEARELFSAALRGMHLTAEVYAAHCALALLLDLGLEPRLREGATLDGLMAGFAPQGRLPLAWMVDLLVDEEMLTREGDRYRLEGPAAPQLEAIRAFAEEVAPGQGINLDLLDAVRRQIPPFFAEGKPGESLLFSLALLPLWQAYFHNDNAVYRPNNLLPMLALEHARRPGMRILELGGGAGSFARLLGQRWTAGGTPPEVAEYRFTDVAPNFLRKAQRELPGELPRVPFTFQAFDLNRDPGEQKLGDARFDAILGVNVLHVAKDLGATLRHLKGLLAPGGRLIVGECLKPNLEHPIYIEFLFNYLHAFTDVALHPAWRPRHGFLTPECWVAALEAAGFTDVQEFPPTRKLMDHFPGFNVGAFSARA